VNCDPSPIQYFWPASVRFVGYQTTSVVQAPQNNGASCGKVSVEPSSWGTVKALYR
jgi:hypothetical protein